MDNNIWRSIASNAAMCGSAPAKPSLVLGILVGSSPSAAWKLDNVAQLYADAGGDIPRTTRPLPETNLYLIQVDESTTVPVLGEVPTPRSLAARGDVHSRRRLHQPRPPPTLLEAVDGPLEASAGASEEMETEPVNVPVAAAPALDPGAVPGSQPVTEGELVTAADLRAAGDPALLNPSSELPLSGAGVVDASSEMLPFDFSCRVGSCGSLEKRCQL